MNEHQKTPPYPEALDFSLDSRIREPLLARIKAECYGALADDDLAGLNAAGPVDEGSYGAGIGGGYQGRVGEVKIDGGTVEPYGKL